MDAVIAKLVLNSTALQSEELNVLMYLMARAIASEEQRERDERFRGKLFSVLDYSSICDRFGILLESAAIRIVKKFESLGWLKFEADGVVLGLWQGTDGVKKKYWYCSNNFDCYKQREAVRETATQQLRRLVADSKKQQVERKLHRLPSSVKSEILAGLTGKKGSTGGGSILSIVKARHVQKFHTSYSMQKDLVQGTPSYPKEIKLLNNALAFCDNEYAKLTEVINFTYDNWSKVKEKLGWLSQSPNASLWATKSYMSKLLGLMTSNYVEELNVGTRFSEVASKNAPDTGFGE